MRYYFPPAITVAYHLMSISNNIDISECPSLATNGDMLYVTWEDLTPGNHEVFYIRSYI
jgi:hypothetical protein